MRNLRHKSSYAGFILNFVDFCTLLFIEISTSTCRRSNVATKATSSTPSLTTYITAVAKYNENLCQVESTLRLALAYANRSAVCFELQMYSTCLQNIELQSRQQLLWLVFLFFFLSFFASIFAFTLREKRWKIPTRVAFFSVNSIWSDYCTSILKAIYCWPELTLKFDLNFYFYFNWPTLTGRL